MIYLDACALIKLLIAEPESEALADHLGAAAEPLVTSELSIVEVHRALIRLGVAQEQSAAAEAILTGFIKLPLAPVIYAAATLPDTHLRSLDALHLATAAHLAQLTELVTYDSRLAEHARDAGLTVSAPS